MQQAIPFPPDPRKDEKRIRINKQIKSVIRFYGEPACTLFYWKGIMEPETKRKDD